jgi:hypothetical protein
MNTRQIFGHERFLSAADAAKQITPSSFATSALDV